MKKPLGNKRGDQVVRPSFFSKFLPELIVFCFAFVLYANSIGNNYNLDDELVTRQHKLTSQGISAIPEIFTSPYYTDNAGYAYEYRPIVLSSFAIEHQFFGDNPHVSHFFNLILYMLCCVLLYRVLYLIIPGGAQLLSLCITLLFVANPTHTEAVCSIKNRDEIFSLLFGLLATYLAYKAVSKKSWLALLLVPATFVLALLSKSTIVSFVVIIPVTLVFFTEAGFAWVLAVMGLLVIPALFAIDFTFWNKLIGSVLLISGLAVFYIIARSKTASVWARLKNAGSLFTAHKEVVNTDREYPPIKGFKVLLVNIMPGAGILNFGSVMLAVIAGAVFVAGVYWVLPPAIIAGALALGFLIMTGKEAAWWWATVILCACLAFAPLQYTLDRTLYGELISAVFIYYVFYGNRKLFIPISIILIIYTGISLYSSGFYVMQNRLFGMIALRAFGWPALIWQYVPIHNFFKHIRTITPDLFSALYNIGVGSFFVTLLMISILLKKGTHYLIGGYIALAIGLMIFFETNVNDPITITAAKNRMEGTINKINPQFIKANQDRPLDYVEQPVTTADKWTLRVGTAFEVIAHYFKKTIVPYPMAFYYGYSVIKPETITEPVPLIGLIIYLALAVLTFVWIHKKKLLSFALIVYLLSLAVFSGYFYPVPGQVAERFMLVPSIGWSILLGSGLFLIFKLSHKMLLKQRPEIPTAPRAVFITILLLYSLVTFSRNFDWKDDLTLFRHDIAYVSESVQAQNILASHIINHEQTNLLPAEQKALVEEAISHYKAAVSIRPAFFNATFDLGQAYLKIGMLDSALAWFIRANEINPEFTEIQYNIADIYIHLGQKELAIPYLEYAVKHRPQDGRGYDKLSYIYFQQQNYYRSIEMSKEGIKNAQYGALFYVNIASNYLSMLKADSAALWAHKALQVDPTSQGAVMILQQTDKMH